MKQYIGISRDHSGSMQSLTKAAMADYNNNVTAIRNAAKLEDIDTIVSTVKCGVGIGTVQREAVNSSVAALKPLTKYSAEGGTPLFDSIGELVTLLEKTPDADDPSVSFLVMAITDGQENQSTKYNAKSFAELIKQKQGTDRWTFVFRVPKGYKRYLTSFGIPEGNIHEWDTTERGLEESTKLTQTAVATYYSARKTSNLRSTDSFYANAASLSKSTIKAQLTDISKLVKFWPVTETKQIRDFVESKLKGKGMVLGAAFYQLSKTEKKVQSYKLICIRDKAKGDVYAGEAARDLLGLPKQGAITLSPGDHGNYDIFVQSASVNRKLVPGTQVLYWENYAATMGSHCPATYAGPVRGSK